MGTILAIAAVLAVATYAPELFEALKAAARKITNALLALWKR